MEQCMINGNLTLEEANELFQEHFPYLYLTFYLHDETQKRQGASPRVITPLSDLASRICDIAAQPLREKTELHIHRDWTIGKFEKVFLQSFFVHVQVSFRDKFGEGFFTSDQVDGKTLSDFNEECCDRKCQKYPGLYVSIDDSSVKHDRVTFICRTTHNDLRKRKIRGLEPLNDTHYARGKRTHLTRLYSAAITNDVVNELCLEWEPENEVLGIAFRLEPPHGSEKFYNRPLRIDEREAFEQVLRDNCPKGFDLVINEGEYYFITGYPEFNYDTFLEVGDDFTDEIAGLYDNVNAARKKAGKVIFVEDEAKLLSNLDKLKDDLREICYEDDIENQHSQKVRDHNKLKRNRLLKISMAIFIITLVALAFIGSGSK